MSYKVARFQQVLEELAPKSLAASWDNVGLQIGDDSMHVDKALVTLTLTNKLVQKAIAANVNLIIAHHPLIFHPLHHLRSDSPYGRVLHALVTHQIAVYICHTNLDHASEGLNYWLAELFSLADHRVLQPLELQEKVGLGRIGYIEPVSLGGLIQKVQSLWGPNLRYVGDLAKTCRKVAICGGSGGDLLQRAAFLGADVFITGDVKYHEALDSVQAGLAIIDPGHFATERIMIPKIASYLEQVLPKCQIIQGDDGDNPFFYT